MAQLHGVILILATSLSTLLTYQTTEANYPIHVITGVQFSLQDTVIPYHSTTQLLYRFPYHTKIIDKIPKTPIDIESCKNLINSSNAQCKDKQFLNEIQNEIHAMLYLNKDNFDPQLKLNNNITKVRTKRAIDFIGNALSYCCNVATMTNLEDLSQNEVKVDDKLNDLLDYVKEENRDLVLAEIKMNNFSNQLNTILNNLHDSLGKYDSELGLNLNQTTKLINNKLMKLTQETWLYIYMTLYYTKLNKIEQDCQNNNIPEDLLPLKELYADLVKLEPNLIQKKLAFAIPISKIFSMYKLKIAKCHYENENIVLQIKIPLKVYGLTYKVYDYKPIPLKWENKICQLSSSNFFIITTETDRFIIDLQNNDDCDYKTSNLCLIPRYNSHSSMASKCAKYLLNGTNLAQLKNFCEFHCTQQPDHYVVTQISVNKFILTNFNEPLIITCENRNSSLYLPSMEIGAVEIHLPCNCKLISDLETVISSIYPCDSREISEPILNHLIPLTWTNLDHLKIDPFDISQRTEFLNITHFLVPDWNISTPTFLNRHLERVTLFNHIQLKNHWMDIVDDKRILLYILFGWNLVLTLILVIHQYKIHIQNIKQKIIQPPLPPRTHLTSTDSIHTTGL